MSQVAQVQLFIMRWGQPNFVPDDILGMTEEVLRDPEARFLWNRWRYPQISEEEHARARQKAEALIVERKRKAADLKARKAEWRAGVTKIMEEVRRREAQHAAAADLADFMFVPPLEGEPYWSTL